MVSSDNEITFAELSATMAIQTAADQGSIQRVKDRIREIRELLAATHPPPQPGDYLLVAEPGKRNFWYLLRAEEVMIGREFDADLVLDDAKVSRYHCRLSPMAGSYRIEDLDSKNGFRINGQRVRDRILCDGDLIEVGAGKALFLRERPASEAAGEPGREKS